MSLLMLSTVEECVACILAIHGDEHPENAPCR